MSSAQTQTGGSEAETHWTPNSRTSTENCTRKPLCNCTSTSLQAIESRSKLIPCQPSKPRVSIKIAGSRKKSDGNQRMRPQSQSACSGFRFSLPFACPRRVSCAARVSLPHCLVAAPWPTARASIYPVKRRVLPRISMFRAPVGILGKPMQASFQLSRLSHNRRLGSQ